MAATDTILLSHPELARHAMQPGHPERPERLRAALDGLRAAGLLERMPQVEARPAARDQLERVHDPAYVEALWGAAPQSGLVRLDPDTALGPHSLAAALRAAGAAAQAVDLVLAGAAPAAFCCVRPPGHHAERRRAMGFCFFDNIAVAAAHALAQHGLERVALVDFDVHHGNGTEDIFQSDPRVLFCSSFQHPHYPFSGADTRSDHIRNVPLPAGTGGAGYRQAVAAAWFAALDRFAPQLLFFSAGFDAHRADPLAQLELDEDDFAWVTAEVLGVCRPHTGGRVVSCLEGGYDLGALGRSVAAHVAALAQPPGLATR